MKWSSGADQINRKSSEFQYWNYEKVETQLQFMTNDECKADFQVDMADLPVLAEALRFPNRFACPNRTVATGMEGSCSTKTFRLPVQV